jgi:hypothetical protein
MTSTLHCNKPGVSGRKPLIGTVRTHYGPHFTDGTGTSKSLLR